MLYFLNVRTRVNYYPYFKFTSENTQQTFFPKYYIYWCTFQFKRALHISSITNNTFTHKRFCKNVLKMNIFKSWKSLVFKFFSKSYLSILHGLPLYFIQLLIFCPNLYKQKENWIKFCSIKWLFHLFFKCSLNKIWSWPFSSYYFSNQEKVEQPIIISESPLFPLALFLQSLQ